MTHDYRSVAAVLTAALLITLVALAVMSHGSIRLPSACQQQTVDGHRYLVCTDENGNAHAYGYTR
jgi:hypothetical protein